MSEPPSIIQQGNMDNSMLTQAYEQCKKFDDDLKSNCEKELKHLQAQIMEKDKQVKNQWGQVIDQLNNRIKEITSVLPAYFAYAIKTDQGLLVLQNSEIRWQVNPNSNDQLYDEFIYSELKDSQEIGLLPKEDLLNRSITGPFTQLQPLLTQIVAEQNKAYQETIKRMDDIKQQVRIIPTEHERMLKYVQDTIQTEKWFFQQNDKLWPQFVELVDDYSYLINTEINEVLKKFLPYFTITQDEIVPPIVIEKGIVVDPLLNKVVYKRTLLINQEPQFVIIIGQIMDTLIELWSLRPQLKLEIIQNGLIQQTSSNIVQITNRGSNESFLIQHEGKMYFVNMFDQPLTIKIPWYVIRRLIVREPLDYSWFCTFVIANGKFNFTDVTLQSVEYLNDHFSHNLEQAQLLNELKRVLTYEVQSNMVLVEKKLNRTLDKNQQIHRYRSEVQQTNHPFQTKHLVLRESDQSLILYQNWKGKEVIIPVNTQIEGIRTFECDDDVPFQKSNLKQFVHFLLYWEAQKNELTQTMIKDYELWFQGENQSKKNLRQIIFQKLEEIKFIVLKVEDICNYEIEVIHCNYEGQKLVKSIEEVRGNIAVRQQNRNMDNITIKDTVCLAVCLISESQFAVITPTLPPTYVNVIPDSLQISQNQEAVLHINIQDEFLQEILGKEKERPNLLAHIILTLQKLTNPKNHILTVTTDHLQQIQDQLPKILESLQTQFEQKKIEKTLKQLVDSHRRMFGETPLQQNLMARLLQEATINWYYDDNGFRFQVFIDESQLELILTSLVYAKIDLETQLDHNLPDASELKKIFQGNNEINHHIEKFKPKQDDVSRLMTYYTEIILKCKQQINEMTKDDLSSFCSRVVTKYSNIQSELVQQAFSIKNVSEQIKLILERTTKGIMDLNISDIIQNNPNYSKYQFSFIFRTEQGYQIIFIVNNSQTAAKNNRFVTMKQKNVYLPHMLIDTFNLNYELLTSLIIFDTDYTANNQVYTCETLQSIMNKMKDKLRLQTQSYLNNTENPNQAVYINQKKTEASNYGVSNQAVGGFTQIDRQVEVTGQQIKKYFDEQQPQLKVLLLKNLSVNSVEMSKTNANNFNSLYPNSKNELYFNQTLLDKNAYIFTNLQGEYVTNSSQSKKSIKVSHDVLAMLKDDFKSLGCLMFLAKSKGVKTIDKEEVAKLLELNVQQKQESTEKSQIKQQPQKGTPKTISLIDYLTKRINETNIKILNFEHRDIFDYYQRCTISFPKDQGSVIIYQSTQDIHHYEMTIINNQGVEYIIRINKCPSVYNFASYSINRKLIELNITKELLGVFDQKEMLAQLIQDIIEKHPQGTRKTIDMIFSLDLYQLIESDKQIQAQSIYESQESIVDQVRILLSNKQEKSKFNSKQYIVKRGNAQTVNIYDHHMQLWYKIQSNEAGYKYEGYYTMEKSLFDQFQLDDFSMWYILFIGKDFPESKNMNIDIPWLKRLLQQNEKQNQVKIEIEERQQQQTQKQNSLVSDLQQQSVNYPNSFDVKQQNQPERSLTRDQLLYHLKSNSINPPQKIIDLQQYLNAFEVKNFSPQVKDIKLLIVNLETYQVDVQYSNMGEMDQSFVKIITSENKIDAILFQEFTYSHFRNTYAKKGFYNSHLTKPDQEFFVNIKNYEKLQFNLDLQFKMFATLFYKYCSTQPKITLEVMSNAIKDIMMADIECFIKILP